MLMESLESFSLLCGLKLSSFLLDVSRFLIDVEMDASTLFDVLLETVAGVLRATGFKTIDGFLDADDVDGRERRFSGVFFAEPLHD